MYRAMSVKSLKSMKSARSVKTELTAVSDPNLHVNFEDFMHHAISKFEVPVSVSVVKEYKQEQYIKTATTGKKLKFKRESMMTPLTELKSSAEVGQPEPAVIEDGHTLFVTAYYDYFNRLIEISMTNYNFYPIPRVLMQLIALVVPSQRNLHKFQIKQCSTDMYTPYELKKILLITNITDVCLDHTFIPECNYDILLSERTNLRNLSLARCKIDDKACEKIAARLHHSQPAAETLRTLNLASNNITDDGAGYLATALRTNRYLRYLNISDNKIGDEGAVLIFGVLSEFPLSKEDTMNSSMRKIQYLKKKELMTQKCLQNLVTKSEENAAHRKTIKKTLKPKKDKKQETEDDIFVKAMLMTEDLLGPFQDPFSPELMTTTNNMCQGNLALCYLNLAYNNLTYTSIQKLLQVVLGQQPYKTDKYCGLINVILDGNYLPIECPELVSLNKEFSKAINNESNTKSGGSYRTSTTPGKSSRSS